MGIISAIGVTLTPTNQTIYCHRQVTVHVAIANAAFGVDYSAGLKCYIYADDFYPMCHTEDDTVTEYDWPRCTITLDCHHIWLPGRYILYIRERDETLTQATLTVDKNLAVSVTDIRTCAPLSREDVVTTCLEDNDCSWDVMAATPGIGALRLKAIDNMRLEVFNNLRAGTGGGTLTENRNLLIVTTNKDLDDTTLDNLRRVMRLGKAVSVVDCSVLYDATRNNPYEQLTELVMDVTGVTICLTNVGALLNTGSKMAGKRIAEKLRTIGSTEAVWMMGTRQEIDSLMEMFPSMKEFFPQANRLTLQPYTAFELVQAAYDTIIRSGMEPSDEATDVLARNILQGYTGGNLAAWTMADIRHFVNEEIKPCYLRRCTNNVDVENPMLLLPDDIDKEKLTGGETDFEESIRELNSMIGLKDIKKGIATMANRTRFYQKRREMGLHTTDQAVFHAIFTGNPGTGKTTVARMLGKTYRALGLLSKGEVMAVDRTRLVGRYIGETEENMKTVLEEARGNVLFIDEAYTLYDGSGDRKDFGGRVIDSLLTVLSQPNPDMLIIFAGYEKEMDAMLQTNPGLFGRFPYKFRFDDYNADELLLIARRLLDREEYSLTDEAARALTEAIGQTYAHRTKNFSNARWVEQFVRNGIIPAMADRVMQVCAPATAALYQTIEAADVLTAYEKFNPHTVELRPRRQIGFSA